MKPDTSLKKQTHPQKNPVTDKTLYWLFRSLKKNCMLIIKPCIYSNVCVYVWEREHVGLFKVNSKMCARFCCLSLVCDEDRNIYWIVDCKLRVRVWVVRLMWVRSAHIGQTCEISYWCACSSGLSQSSFMKFVSQPSPFSHPTVIADESSLCWPVLYQFSDCGIKVKRFHGGLQHVF